MTKQTGASKWVQCSLDDVCRLVNGRAYKRPELLEEGKYRVLRVGNLFTNNSWFWSDLELDEDKYIDDGDLIYAWSASFGPRIWRGEKVIYHYHIWKCLPDPALIDKHFLYRLFEWDVAKIKADHGTGSTMIHVTKGDMEARQIGLPPLPEQRRIVAKLDRLSARSAAARDHLARTTKLATRAKQAILAEAFRGGVSSKEHREYADRKEIASPFAIPATWQWKTAEELCEWITKGTTPKRDDLNPDCGDVPFIKVYNLTFDGSLDFTKEPTFVSKSVHEGLLKRSKVFPGDILMNIVGPPLGKVSIIPDTHPEWNMNQAIAVFRAKDEVLPAFLAKWLLSETYLSWATALSKATAGQRNLTLEICRRSPVPVPPLDEQVEIVRRIESAFARIDRITEEASRAAHLLDRLDERLLAKAFRGELVPQDPEDEPAEALLTRIREARAAAPKAKRGRKTKAAAE